VMPMLEVAKRGLAGIDPDVHRAAATAITPIGSASRDVGLAAERRRARTTIAGTDPDLHPVEEHRGHCRTADRRSRSYPSGPRRPAAASRAERRDSARARPGTAQWRTTPTPAFVQRVAGPTRRPVTTVPEPAPRSDEGSGPRGREAERIRSSGAGSLVGRHHRGRRSATPRSGGVGRSPSRSRRPDRRSGRG
jgi:hypothetical protein